MFIAGPLFVAFRSHRSRPLALLAPDAGAALIPPRWHGFPTRRASRTKGMPPENLERQFEIQNPSKRLYG
jgi:hypothetical protein